VGGMWGGRGVVSGAGLFKRDATRGALIDFAGIRTEVTESWPGVCRESALGGRVRDADGSREKQV